MIKNTEPIKVLHHSSFKPKSFGHGGERHTAMVVELLRDEGFVVDDIDWKDLNSRSKIFNALMMPIYFVYYLWFCIESGTWIPPLPKPIAYLGFSYIQFKKIVKPYIKEYNIFVWESTYDNYFIIPYLIKKQGLPVIALPHNLESLIRGRKSFFFNKKAPLWLREEIRILKMVDVVFVVSREEEWLLNLHGVNAFYYPYLGNSQVIKYCENIRRQRRGNGNILLLGTANNAPTYFGMQELLRELDGQLGDVQIEIAGYATEKLSTDFPRLSNFKILGTLSNEELEDKLIACKAVLINNYFSSGSLTRIIEMMYCNIPMIVNTGSARSHFYLDGISIYRDYDELKQIIKHYDFKGNISYKEYNAGEFEKYFIKSLKKLVFI